MTCSCNTILDTKLTARFQPSTKTGGTNWQVPTTVATAIVFRSLETTIAVPRLLVWSRVLANSGAARALLQPISTTLRQGQTWRRWRWDVTSIEELDIWREGIETVSWTGWKRCRHASRNGRSLRLEMICTDWITIIHRAWMPFSLILPHNRGSTFRFISHCTSATYTQSPWRH